MFGRRVSGASAIGWETDAAASKRALLVPTAYLRSRRGPGGPARARHRRDVPSPRVPGALDSLGSQPPLAGLHLPPPFTALGFRGRRGGVGHDRPPHRGPPATAARRIAAAECLQRDGCPA